MKATTLLIALCLIGATFATSAEEVEVYDQLNKIEATKFGSTLLDTIALQMQAGDPVDDLVHLLQRMENGLAQEQAEADKAIEEYQASCDINLEKLAQEIQAAKEEIKRQQAILDEKIPQRDRALNELRDLERFRDMLVDKLAMLDRNYDKKKEEWKTTQEQHNYAISVIQQAKNIITTNLQAGKSFLQTQQQLPAAAFAQVSQHLTNSVKRSPNKKGVFGLFRILAQILNSAPIQSDQSAVGHIIALIDSILSSMQESFEIERKDFQNFEDEYKVIKQSLERRLNEVKHKITDLQQLIQSLNRIIKQCQDIIADQREKVAVKTEVRAKLLDECNAAGVTYASERQSRDEKRQVISQTLQLFQAKLRLFKKYVNERLKRVHKAA